MRKLIMALATAFAAAMPLIADTEKMDTGYTWSYQIANGEAEITSGGTAPAISPIPDEPADITIPSILGGCPVTRIGNYAFKGVYLSSVTLHEGIKSIGDYAFCGIGDSVSQVFLPESLTTIGAHAFSSNQIRKVIIPQGVKEIGQYAFADTEIYYLLMAKTWDGAMHETVLAEKQEVNYYTIGETCTVSIYKGDGSPKDACSVCRILEVSEERMIKCGEPVGTLPVLAPREGYRFGGWWIDRVSVCQTCTLGGVARQVGPDTVIYEDTTIRPFWEKDDSMSRYALSGAAGDRTIISMTIAADIAIPTFTVLEDVSYDCVLRIVNTSAHDVHVTLPAGYTYETFKGATPLTIPANSRNILTITRTADKVFLVSREELEVLQ